MNPQPPPALRYGSVCSGIEAVSLAWQPLGLKPDWFAEIDPFPCAVLAHHYPEVRNLGDMALIPDQVRAGAVPAPGILAGGTPCQAFSVAGLRESLADARGNLTLTFVEIANAIDQARTRRGEDGCVVFWENVPGVLSTKDNAFGCLLAGLAGEDGALEPPEPKPAAGKSSRHWKWDRKLHTHTPRWANAGAVHGPRRAAAWRTLDAQYFGVAQRRRRVFVVASARKGFDPATVLFEWGGVRRDTAPGREARQTAPTLPARRTAGGGLGTDFDCDGGLIAALPRPMAADAGPWHGGEAIAPVAHSLRGEGFDASEDGTGRGTPLVAVAVDCTNGRLAPGGPSGTLEAAQSKGNRGAGVLAFDTTQITSAANRSNPRPGDACHPLAAGAHAPAIALPADPSSTPYAGTEGATPSMGAPNPAAVAFQASQSGVRVCGVHATLDSHNGPRRHNGALQGSRVRRLTPEECEALQGIPRAAETITFASRIDHQGNAMLVALQCRTSRSGALPAGEGGPARTASLAEGGSSAGHASPAPLAALRLRMRAEDTLLEVCSHGRLVWSTHAAGANLAPHPSTLPANAADGLARLLRDLMGTGPHGRVASFSGARLSFPAPAGETGAGGFMPETTGNPHAGGAKSERKGARFTASDLGRLTPACGSAAAALCRSVMAAASGFIPSGPLPDAFSVELTVETPYTAIPWRGKPASQCPDGPRYKAIGNSMAVPCVAWLGRRIVQALR